MHVRVLWASALVALLVAELVLSAPQYGGDAGEGRTFGLLHKKKRRKLGCRGRSLQAEGRTFVVVYNNVNGGGGGYGGGGHGDGGGGDDGDGDYDDPATSSDDCDTGGGGGGLLGHGGLLGGLLGDHGGGGGGGGGSRYFNPDRYLRSFYRALRPIYRLF